MPKSSTKRKPVRKTTDKSSSDKYESVAHLSKKTPKLRNQAKIAVEVVNVIPAKDVVTLICKVFGAYCDDK